MKSRWGSGSLPLHHLGERLGARLPFRLRGDGIGGEEFGDNEKNESENENNENENKKENENEKKTKTKTKKNENFGMPRCATFFSEVSRETFRSKVAKHPVAFVKQSQLQYVKTTSICKN